MYKVPIKYVFHGDRHECGRHMRRGAVLMDMLEHLMSFRGLKQGVLRRAIAPNALVECDCRFGLRTVTITITPGGGMEAELLRECFANSTVALAYVLDVVGVKSVQEGEPGSVDEPVCATCIGAESYPLNYYCTRGIRYTLAICDGKGEYLLYKLTKGASTDYTPRCPGEQVLVMQNRTSNLPRAVLDAAVANPYGKQYWTRPLSAFLEECVSILPYTVSMPRIYEVTGQ